MHRLSSLFKPITVKPYRHSFEVTSDRVFVEVPPCKDLSPYVRCYWGNPKPYANIIDTSGVLSGTRVICDVCMDIIVTVDYNSNIISHLFCGIGDTPFFAYSADKTSVYSTFAIRFNSWAVHLFADDHMRGVCNAFVDTDQYFRGFKEVIESIMLDKPEIDDRIAAVEGYLKNRLHQNRRTNQNVLNACYHMFKSRGIVSIKEVCQATTISQKQLERLFYEYLGVTPKKLNDLVRFQNVWQDICFCNKQSISDIVFEYGYSDQSHMINDFKKYAGCTPLELLKESRDSS